MHQLPSYANIFIVVLVLWTIPWKLYALWTAAKRDDKRWFFALVVLNTCAILEIIYIFKIAKKSWAEVKAAFRGGWETLRSTKKEDFKSHN
jgi:hypothetical protein